VQRIPFIQLLRYTQAYISDNDNDNDKEFYIYIYTHIHKYIRELYV